MQDHGSTTDPPPSEFAATREELDDEILITVRGDVDMATADKLLAALAPDSGRPFVIDLSETTFMDSAGLAVLVTARNQGAEIVLRNPSEIVRSIIAVVALDQVFDVEG